MTQDHHRRNVFWLASVESGWGLAFGVGSAHILLPVFLRELGATATVIALIPAVMSLGHTLPQLLTPWFTGHLESKKASTFWWHMVPGTILAGGPLYFLFVKTQGPFDSFDRGLYLFFFALSTCVVGFAIPLWLEFLNRTLDPASRGTGVGIIFTTQNFFSAVGSGAASWLLAHTLPFPGNYALCFLLTAFFMCAANFGFIPVRERPHSAPAEPRKPFLPYLRHFFEVLAREPLLRMYLLSRLCMQVYPALVSFYAVYAADSFGATGSDAALLSMVFLASQTLASVLTGWLGDRFGHGLVVTGGILCLAAGMVCVLFASSMVSFYVASVFAGFFFATFIVAHINWVMELAPEGDKTLYLSVPGVALAPAMVGAPMLLGWWIDHWSYRSALAASLIVVGLGFLLALRTLRRERAERRRVLAAA
jgi:MFS family permease